jgi:hypothetical protein
MKIYLSLLLLVAMAFVSCSKDCNEGVPTSLEGSWKMLAVKDRSTGTITNKPTSLSGDVVLSFEGVGSAGGTLRGTTPSNSFGPDPFSLGAGATLSIPHLSMTKVAETVWGAYFVDHIREAEKYSFEEGDGLSITTTNKILFFRKN